MLESLEYDLLKHAMIKMSFVAVVLKFNSETETWKITIQLLIRLVNLFLIKKLRICQLFDKLISLIIEFAFKCGIRGKRCVLNNIYWIKNNSKISFFKVGYQFFFVNLLVLQWIQFLPHLFLFQYESELIGKKIILIIIVVKSLGIYTDL